MAKTEKTQKPKTSSIEEIFGLHKTPKPEQKENMVQSWGRPRKPKTKKK